MAWTSRDNGTALDLFGVTFGAGVFVAVGESAADEPGSLLLTSPDGVTWTRRPSGVSKTLWNVAYGNGSFVAVGEPGILLRSGVLSQENDLRLSEPAGIGNQFRFRFGGQVGHTYQVQASNDLNAWTPLQTLV